MILIGFLAIIVIGALITLPNITVEKDSGVYNLITELVDEYDSDIWEDPDLWNSSNKGQKCYRDIVADIVMDRYPRYNREAIIKSIELVIHERKYANLQKLLINNQVDSEGDKLLKALQSGSDFGYGTQSNTAHLECIDSVFKLLEPTVVPDPANSPNSESISLVKPDDLSFDRDVSDEFERRLMQYVPGGYNAIFNENEKGE